MHGFEIAMVMALMVLAQGVSLLAATRSEWREARRVPPAVPLRPLTPT